MAAGPSRDAVVAVIQRHGRFLFVERAQGVPAAGFWCPVSGGVEAGETQLQALLREVMEELGVEARGAAKIAELDTPDGAYRLHYWRTELLGEPRLASAEATALGWYTIEELRGLEPTFRDDVRVCEQEASSARP